MSAHRRRPRGANAQVHQRSVPEGRPSLTRFLLANLTELCVCIFVAPLIAIMMRT